MLTKTIERVIRLSIRDKRSLVPSVNIGFLSWENIYFDEG